MRNFQEERFALISNLDKIFYFQYKILLKYDIYLKMFFAPFYAKMLYYAMMSKNSTVKLTVGQRHG